MQLHEVKRSCGLRHIIEHFKKDREPSIRSAIGLCRQSQMLLYLLRMAALFFVVASESKPAGHHTCVKKLRLFLMPKGLVVVPVVQTNGFEDVASLGFSFEEDVLQVQTLHLYILTLL